MAQLRDNVIRTKESSPLGKTVFALVRLADPFLQYALLGLGYGNKILSTVGLGSSITGTVVGLVDPRQKLLLACSIGSALKQILWVGFVGEETLPVSSALMVGAFNSLLNTINTLAGLYMLGRREFGYLEYAGIGLFAIGMIFEFGSEIQRKLFKSKPENKGKIHTTGLFALARHINYGGYVLWRTGYGFASGSIYPGLFNFGFFTYDFVTRGIPVLDEYMQKKYEDQWKAYKTRTPSKLFPGIY